jgi:DNA invertase Pin-like site-specific DNA recombinase
MRVIGYCRVSTAEQGDSGAGLEAQEDKIRAEVAHRGWELVDVRHDVASGKSMRRRDELGRTLRDLRDGYADAVVVAKLDRLSRSVLDFAGIMETAKEEGWSLVVLDLAVDTTTTNGKLIANIMIALAQWERELIGDRTRVALEAVRARGTKVGRKSGVDIDTLRTINLLRNQGMSWAKVAAALEAEGIPTGQGGRWHAATVRRLAMSSETDAGATDVDEPLPVG